MGYRRDGVVIRASVSQSVDLRLISQVESYQKTFKKWYSQRPCLGAQQIGIVWRTSQQACLLCLGQDTLRDASIFMWQTGDGAKQSTSRGGPSPTEDLQTERER